MSTDALLTLAAAVVAILTLLSPEARDDLRLRITPLTQFVAALAFAVLVAIKLSPVWIALGFPVLGDWRWGFDPEIASFATIAVATAYIVVRFFTMKLQPRRIEGFARLSERLLFAGKYSELLFLLERHFVGLGRLVENQHVSTKLREWLKPSSWLDVFIDNRRVGGTETIEEWREEKKKLKYRLRMWLAERLPNHDERKNRARRLLDRIFLSGEFVNYLSKARPDFALRVLDVKASFFTEPFLDMLIGAWMRNTNSVLYEETAQNQNLREHHRYEFTPLNPVLWHLFGGPFRAEKLAIYKPVGDFVSDELARLGRTPELDIHRKPQPGFSQEGKWRSPIHVGLRLFDYWISESLHRGSHWHGWLMYWEGCVESIAQNMADLPRVDDTLEFPTPYHYLLYDVFATIGNWIEDSTEIDQGLESVQIDSVNMKHDTIAKSAVITYGRCFRAVIESKNLTVKFKAYILDMVLYQYEKAVERADLKQLYEMSILKGGDEYNGIDEYYAAMRQVLPAVDRSRLYLEPGNDLYEIVERAVRNW